MVFTVLLAVTVICGAVFIPADATCYCVQPENERNSSCRPCNSECHPLSHYVNNTSFVHNDATFDFLPGEHCLNTVWILKSVHNINISSTLCHYNSSVRIKCSSVKSGVRFENITQLGISGVSFINCGHTHFNKTEEIASALLLIKVRHLNISRVFISNSNGWGLYCYSLLGNSTIHSSKIIDGHYYGNYSGGNLRFKYVGDQPLHTSHVLVSNTFIKGGKENQSDERAYSGGIDIYFKTRSVINITFYNVTVCNNSGFDGGNVAVTYATVENGWNSSISFINCTFSNGNSSRYGGGIYMEAIPKNDAFFESKNESNFNILVIRDTNFTQNKAEIAGAGMYLQLHESQHLSVIAAVLLQSCHFVSNNVSRSNTQGGVAVHVVNFKLPGAIPHYVPQFNVSFDNCLFSKNGPIMRNETSLGCGVLYFAENALTVLRDTNISDNNCSGIAAAQSIVKMYGNISIERNWGYNGGGILLCSNAVMFLSDGVQVHFVENHAQRFGGGIYAEFECSQAIPPCFYGIENMKNTSVFLENNTASRAGDEIYGGSIDLCYITPDTVMQTFNNSEELFDHLFMINHTNNTMSEIASDPFQVCFCSAQQNEPATFNRSVCNFTHNSTAYPGTVVYVHVVIVGQRNGTVPGSVRASFRNGNYSINNSEISQHINSSKECAMLSYTIYVNETIHSANNVQLSLSVENEDIQTLSPNRISPTYVNLKISKCPYGFALSKNECLCAQALKQNLKGLKCSIRDRSLTRKVGVNWWIGMNKSSIIFSLFCAFDFCDNTKKVILHIDENTTFEKENTTFEKQCAFNRKGILCGECRKDLSNMLGSSNCKNCIKYTPLMTTLLTLAFALAGIMLLVFLGIFSLNVTEAAINPLIFYANILRVNSVLFFGSGKTIASNFLRVFVAWMNLDLGIEICYYTNMTAFGKTLLQFLFAFYLLFLTGLIIFLSRQFTLASRIAGKNTIRLLATIILLSYAKIIRTVIDVVWPSTLLSLEDNSITYFRTVWKMSGNMEYFHDDHRFLFLFAVIVAALTLPYTLSLLFIQCLKKKSHFKVLCWVIKLKPFFDAYTGPYKDRYHFWTGFLLVVRIVVFVAIATNTKKGPILNLTIVCVTAAVLFLLNQPGVYKARSLSLIESFTYLNLIILSMGTAYFLQTPHPNNDITLIICVGSVFVLFCGIVLFNITVLFLGTQFWRDLKMSVQEKWRCRRKKQIKSLLLHNSLSESSSSSGDEEEQNSLLLNAPPVARYDQLREPLVETGD